MATTVQLALSGSERAQLHALVQAIAPEAQAWVFGSRATGRARPFSDLDLLLMGKRPLTWEQRAALADALEQSDLPFRVDVVEPCGLAPGFLARIELERVPLQGAGRGEEPPVTARVSSLRCWRSV